MQESSRLFVPGGSLPDGKAMSLVEDYSSIEMRILWRDEV